MRGCTIYYCSRIRSRLPSSYAGELFFEKSRTPLLFEFAVIRIYYGYILLLISRLIDLARNSVCLSTCWLAAAYRWEWRRREVHYNSNFCLPGVGLSCWTFRDGLFSCRICVNCTDTRVSIPSSLRLLFVVYWCSREYNR